MNKPIWLQQFTAQDLNNNFSNNMATHLGIVFLEAGENYLKASMPVDHRTKQPYGLLHGGASCVLAETLGSMAANLCLDQSKEHAVGIEINANHIKSVTSGVVTGITIPLHVGRNTHVWEIKIYDEQNKLVCVSRLTVAVVKKS